MFRKMPFILLLLIAAILSTGPVLPYAVKQGLYALSLSMKEVIVFILPCIIFGLLFKSCVALSSSTTKIIGLILALVCCSNFTSTFISHYVGIWIYSFDLSIVNVSTSENLIPLWTFSLPKIIPNDIAMFSGIILGLIASKFFTLRAKEAAFSIDQVISKLLSFITMIVPIFIIGFIVKMQYDGVIQVILKDYAIIFALVALTQFMYIGLLYFLFSNYQFKSLLTSIKNIMPAAISGFTTMSSATSMPLTIIGAENNALNKDIARSVIPATVNIHLIGDCFAIPIFAYAVLKSFGMPEPSLVNYIIFSGYFVMAKFSVAAVPGGGILVMLPILASYLNFNADMMSLITALYILFDPVITSANVLGNGAFAKMIDKMLWKPENELSAVSA